MALIGALLACLIQTPMIHVTKDKLFDTPISPLIYGEFVEFLNDLIPGMWAERVKDRSFEGSLQPTQTWPPDQDWTKPQWKSFATSQWEMNAWPNGDQFGMVDAGADFVLDAVNPFAGKYSAQVRVHSNDSRPHLAGTCQENIFVRKGEKLHFEMYARGSKPLTVLLGQQYGTFFHSYGTLTFTGVTGEWQRFHGEFSPTGTGDATLAIAAGEDTVFWVDKVSLMPTDTVHGWREDVVNALAATHPGVIRFGGSSLIFYRWETGIGPREKRAAFENKPWHNMEEHDVGLHEFLDLCEAVKVQPLVCLNSNVESVESLLNEIEYCNGPADSKYGKIRASMGHPQPFNVKYWQVGNEQGGPDYERKLFEVCRAIRAKHPDLILLSSYPSDAILHDKENLVDIVCPHFYEPYTKGLEDRLRAFAQRMREANRKLKIGVTEWNSTAGDFGWGRSWLMTHFNALNTALYLNMFQRLGDSVVVANRSNILNCSCAGTIQTKPGSLFVTPAYHVKQVYGVEGGDEALSVAGSHDGLDVSATRRSSDGQVAVFVVNTGPSAIVSTLDFEATGDVHVWMLEGDMDAVNSFEEPSRVSPHRTVDRISCGRLDHAFPPRSVTVLTFKRT